MCLTLGVDARVTFSGCRQANSKVPKDMCMWIRLSHPRENRADQPGDNKNLVIGAPARVILRRADQHTLLTLSNLCLSKQ